MRRIHIRLKILQMILKKIPITHCISLSVNSTTKASAGGKKNAGFGILNHHVEKFIMSMAFVKRGMLVLIFILQKSAIYGKI